MSTRKSERIMNLLISMLSSTRPLSKHRIRQLNEGYRGLNDSNFERTFERDKDELRSIGVRILTEEIESELPGEVGYRIERNDYELPPLKFTHEEMAVLGAASHAWQESVAARETGEAIAALRADGMEVDPARLLTLKPHITAEPGFDEIRRALLERREITFVYRGKDRRLQPWRLLMRLGQWYVLGFDLHYQEPRHYKLKRIESEVGVVGKPGAFEVPETAAEIEFASDEARAVVALHEDVATDLRRGADRVETDDDLPPGFAAWSVAMPNPRLLVAEICGLGPGAIALEPPEVRDQVIAQLTAVARRWQG